MHRLDLQHGERWQCPSAESRIKTRVSTTPACHYRDTVSKSGALACSWMGEINTTKMCRVFFFFYSVVHGCIGAIA